LIASQVWLFFRERQLEEDNRSAQSQITLLSSNVTLLSNRISSLESSTYNLSLKLSGQQAAISTLASGLDYVTPLAENGNRYAHSHNTWSDERLKTNVVGIPNALDTVTKLHGVHFNWNSIAQRDLGLDDGPQIGLIAQEVEQVYPELVTTGPDGYKQVDYAKLTPILIEAIKQQEARIKALEDRGRSQAK
jgi:hypothetical protein